MRRVIAMGGVTMVLVAAGCGGGQTGRKPPAPTSTTPGYIAQRTMNTDGEYAVGEQILAGVWHTDGGRGGFVCSWQKKRGSNVLDSGLIDGPSNVTVSPTGITFVTDGCKPWRLLTQLN